MKVKKKTEQTKKLNQAKNATTTKTSPSSANTTPSPSILKPKTRGDEKKKSPNATPTAPSSSSSSLKSNSSNKSEEKDSVSNSNNEKSGVEKFLGKQAPRLSPRRLASKSKDRSDAQQVTNNNGSNNNNSGSVSNSTSNQNTPSGAEASEGRRMSSRRRKPSWRVTAMESDSSDQQQNSSEGKVSTKERKNSSPTRSEKSAPGGKKVVVVQRKEEPILPPPPPMKTLDSQQKQNINNNINSGAASKDDSLRITTSPSLSITTKTTNITPNTTATVIPAPVTVPPPPTTLTNGSPIKSSSSNLPPSSSPTKMKPEVIIQNKMKPEIIIQKPNIVASIIVNKDLKITEKNVKVLNNMEIIEEVKLPSSITVTVNGHNDNINDKEKRKTECQEVKTIYKQRNHSEDFLVQAKRLKLANTITVASSNKEDIIEEKVVEKQKESIIIAPSDIPVPISTPANEKIIISPYKLTISPKQAPPVITHDIIEKEDQGRKKEDKKINNKVTESKEDEDEEEEEEEDVQQVEIQIDNIRRLQKKANENNKKIENTFYKETATKNKFKECCCNESSLNMNELRMNRNLRPADEKEELLAVDDPVVGKPEEDLLDNASSNNIDSVPFETFCQAVDLVDSQHFGCIRPATQNLTLYRVSQRQPFMILCSYHVSRLKLHQCCPLCGMFCLQGTGILLCTGNIDISNQTTMTSHLFHRTCAIGEILNSSLLQTDNNNDSSFKNNAKKKEQQSNELLNSKIVCPHCGHDGEDLNEISVRFQAAHLPVFVPERPNSIRKIAPATLPKTVNISIHEDLSLRYVEDSTASRLATAMSEAKLLVAKFPKTVNRLDSFLRALLDKDIARVMAALLAGDVANSKFPSRNNQSALHVAVASRDICLIHGLLVCGANPNVKDDSGVTPLMLTGKLNEPILAKYLIAAGAEKFEKDARGMNVVHIAAMEGNVVVLKSILEDHPDYLKTVETEMGMTPLMIAAKYGKAKVVNYLATYWPSEINIRALDYENNTALHWSCACGAVQAVSVLLKNGAELLNAKNLHGQTPLHLAVQNCQDGCVLVLLVNGCDLTIKDENEKTPLDLCADDLKEETEQNATLLSHSNYPEDGGRKRNNIVARKSIQACIIQTSTLRSVLSLDIPEGQTPTIYRIVSKDISNGKESHGVIQCINSVDEENLPDEFTYITTSVFRNSTLTPPIISSSKRLKCKCKSVTVLPNASESGGRSNAENGECPKSNKTPILLGTCCSDGCSCSKNGSVYDANGRLLAQIINHFDSSQLPVINECNQLCHCDVRQCSNRVVQKGIKLELQVFKTDYKGWGVKVLCRVPRGSFICTYEGEIVSIVDSSSTNHHKSKVSNPYFFELYDNSILIDSSKYGNVSRFINHSCSPNIVPMKVLGGLGHEDERFSQIAFFAMRDIEANEELSYDYGEKFWELKISEGCTCDCETDVCRYQVSQDEEMDLGDNDEFEA